jgi:hypothetical protein
MQTRKQRRPPMRRATEACRRPQPVLLLYSSPLIGRGRVLTVYARRLNVTELAYL